MRSLSLPVGMSLPSTLSGRLRAAALFLAPALLAAGGPIASASAATVSANGPIVSVTDGNGATNSLAVSASGTTVTVVDSTTPPTAGAGCSRPSPDRVTCTVAGLGALSIDAGGGNDTVTVAGSVPATIADGAGDDRVTGGDGDDTFVMGTGSDVVNGGGGTDTADYWAAPPR